MKLKNICIFKFFRIYKKISLKLKIDVQNEFLGTDGPEMEGECKGGG